jgi:hypothetical protein
MGERHRSDLERPEVEHVARMDEPQLDLAGQPLLLQLVGDQPGGERRRVERHLEVGGKVGNGADVILMAMGQDQRDQILAALFDEFEVGKDEVDAGIIRLAKGHPAVDHQPFAVGPVEIDVHANLARAAKREEE